MIFNSLTFLYFFILVLFVNYLLPIRLRNLWILIAGLLFYMSWNPIYVLLLLGTAAVDYFIAIKMATFPNQKERKPWLIASLTFSLGSLGFFKYTNMLLHTAGSFAQWSGIQWHEPFIQIALPLGISFYTFETISYAVDVYRGNLQPKRSFFEYLSFLMFFPKLIAGPIVRASELLYQIPLARQWTDETFKDGINLLMIGFGKKVLFADNFAPFVERVFAHPSANNRWMCLSAVYGYSMQVYFDFSAYSDIARGCAKLLGYHLPVNFNKPYLSVSISEFWRRWHMTLSRWLRDYLYFPLGGNKGTQFQTYRNLFLTMLLGGLWHGANWTFVMWGALNGTFLLVERFWHDRRGTKPKKREAMSLMEKIARGFIVFNLITLTRIFFRSPTFGVALEMLHSIAKPSTTLARYDFAMFLIPFMTLVYIVLSPLRERIMRFEPKGALLAGYGAFLVLLMVFGATNAEFIYFHF